VPTTPSANPIPRDKAAESASSSATATNSGTISATLNLPGTGGFSPIIQTTPSTSIQSSQQPLLLTAVTKTIAPITLATSLRDTTTGDETSLIDAADVVESVQLTIQKSIAVPPDLTAQMAISAYSYSQSVPAAVNTGVSIVIVNLVLAAGYLARPWDLVRQLWQV
jgi:hypothetical protein